VARWPLCVCARSVPRYVSAGLPTYCPPSPTASVTPVVLPTGTGRYDEDDGVATS
jgi:hypothetical protein